MLSQRHITCFLLTVLLTASCVPLPTPSGSALATRQEPWDCTEVIDTRLESFPFDADVETARGWVQTRYMLNAADVQFDLSADGAQSMLHWRAQPVEAIYGAVFWNDARESARISVNWYGQAPSLADVLRCLGDPSFYRAFLAPTPGGDWTCLELWYPERGIIATTYVTRKVFVMTTNQPVRGIVYVRPGLPDDLIIRTTWSITRDSDRYVEILKGLKPWPGDITKITIDERG